MPSKKKLTLKTKFVRDMTFTTPDGHAISIARQPYAIGMYECVSVDGKVVEQGGFSWDVAARQTEKAMRGRVADGCTDVAVRTMELGQFLSEDDLRFVNED